MWVPTCGLACSNTCPTALHCKSFLACGKGGLTPRDGVGARAPAHSPTQLYMDEEEVRRCRLYSASMPRLRTNAMPTCSAGADFWKKWVRRAGASVIEAAEAASCSSAFADERTRFCKSDPCGLAIGRPVLGKLDEEEVLFEAPLMVTPPSSPRTKFFIANFGASRQESWLDSPKFSRYFPKAGKEQVVQSRLSAASTTASSCCSPGRRRRSSLGSLPSRSSCGSSTSAEEVGADKSLLSGFPLPMGIRSWDWPLSRDEKKALVLMFDRQELIVERDHIANQVVKLRCLQ